MTKAPLEADLSAAFEPREVWLSPDATLHLRRALERMDRLQQTQDCEQALGHLLAMMRDLRVVRRCGV
jgi:hypothetical protein